MVKLTPELINQSMQYMNPCRDRELDLRGNYKILGYVQIKFRRLSISFIIQDTKFLKLKIWGLH